MGGMIEHPPGSKSDRRVAATTGAPLAEVTCCRDIPEIQDKLEPSNEPQLRPGHVLGGRFHIREPVGRSGMATVYRAEDMRDSRREVAVKVPLLSAESDPARFMRFQHEEEIGLELDHPLLLKFLPVNGTKRRPYLVTEFLRGCTLNHLGRDTRPLPEADALKIASLIADAVGYMHTQGFIHRDLKPSNIMICTDRTLRVMDFGLSSPPIRERSVLARLTTTFGTPEYMAPEQVENQSIDERSDIYGLGAILYELLTGSVPFQNDDPWQSAFQRTTGDPIAPRILNPTLSPQAEEIVLHAMQRDPAGRYADMAAFKADLDAPTRVAVTGYSERLQRPRWKVSFQATPVLAGVLLGVGALLFLVLLFLFTLARLSAK